ncbi:acyl-ACP--UDP-N-acetylglucosamine O-acyltransferase [Alteromonas sp. a30]|uniref:acyl-ACP--UDP-N-acetylglucosamine O-acyltransferase n=1 Tax=Alteromonas sp. a30 TaxID=2730917 RepID=UPI0022816064|nr:acyl-ACP--UDP-N-acetylglucosamine O-acyltransferase [Alteromonas sp. a30]MCY7294313.1 acyl-ACP--UDP-N-acetylglucosamine O-acyltransferase [Alteromonas sp. a30]
MIHETAIIHSEAKLGNNVSVGPYTVIGPKVEIGDDCQIHSHVVIKGPSKIGKNNRIFQFASIGEDCQDKKFAGEDTFLEIGDNNIFRESVTVHRGTVQDKGITKIGSNNLFMAYAHVAHDCIVGDNCIFANACTLAGHVKVGDGAILGGLSAVHQFCHIGAYCFAGGGSIVLKDLPPYVMLGHDGKPHGINSEGLRRRGKSKETIMAIKRAYRAIFRSGLTAAGAIVELEKLAQDEQDVNIMVEFMKDSTRGIVR